MPNHVYNCLTIAGGPADILQIRSDLRDMREDPPAEDRDRELCFNNLIPQPEEVSNQTRTVNDPVSAMPNWYIWRIDNWGTKWEPWDVFTETTVGELWTEVCYTFKTAWAPPQGIFDALVEKYPTVTIHLSYTEEFGQMSGFWLAKDGEIIEKADCNFDIATAESLLDAETAFNIYQINPVEHEESNND